MKSNSVFWNRAGVAAGIAAVVFGFLVIVVKMTWFLGEPAMDGPVVWLDKDSVPDLYHAVYTLGYAVTQLYKLVANLFGAFFIFLGMVDICVFRVRLAQYDEDDKENKSE